MSQNKSIIQRAKELLESKKEIQPSQYQENLEQIVNEFCESQLDLESKNTKLLKLQEELKNEKERYSEFFNKSPLGYIIVNEYFIIQEINATACDLFETNPSALKKQRIEKYIHPDSQDEFYLFLKKAFKTKSKETAVITFISDKKEEIYTRIFSLPEEENLKLAILNISSEHALSEHIEKKESLIQDIQKAGRLGIWAWHIEENRVDWNEEMFQLFGLDKKSFSGNLNEVIQNTIHPEDRKKVEASNLAVIKDKSPQELNYRVIWSDGSVHHIHAHAGRLELNEKGEAAVLHGIAQDVSDVIKAEEALKASEKQYKFLAEKASDVVWLMDLKGQSLFVSPSVQKFTGFTEEEYLQQSIEDRFTPESAKTAKDTLEKELVAYAYMNKIPKDYSKTLVLDYLCKNGNIKTGEILITPYFNDNNDLIGLHGVTRDVTERAKIQKELKESETKYRQLYENNPIGLYRTNISGEIVDGNQALADLLEYKTFNELKSRNVEDGYINIEDRRKFIEYFNKNSVFNSISVWKTKSEKKIWVEERAIAIRDDNNEIKFFDGSVIDITDRKKAEDALKTSEQKLKNIIDHSTNMFYSHDINGVITFISPQVREVLGYEPEEAKRDWNIFITDNPINEKGINLTEKAIKTGERQPTYELELRRKDGKIITVEVREAPLVENGKVVTIVGSLSDITERKKAEEEKRKINERFRIAQDMSPDGFTIFKPVRNAQNKIVDFIWIYQNAAVAKINGTDPEKVVGTSFLKLFPGIKGTQFWNAYIQVAETGKSMTFEDSYFGESMTEKSWLHIVVVPMEENIAILAHNITESKLAEQEIKKRENLLNKIFDILPVGLWLADKNGKLFRSNKKGREIWGAEPLVDPSEYGVFQARRIGSKRYLEPEDWALFKTITKGETVEDEMLEIEAFDNTKRVVLNYTTPVYDENNEIEAAVIVNQDISKVWNLEKSLIESEQKFRFIAENSIDVIWQMDLRLKFTYLSPSLKELTGFETEEWIGTPLWNHAKRREFMKMARQALATIRDYKNRGYACFQSALICKDGSEIPVEIIGKPLLNEDGKLIGLQGSTRDISDRIASNTAIEEKNIILEKLNQYSSELTSAKQFNETISLIMEHLQTFIKADLLVFNRFDPVKMLLIPVKINCNNKVLNIFEKLIGKSAFEINTQLNEEVIEEMIKSYIKHSNSMHELSMGAIPKAISSTFSTLTGLKTFTAITFIKDGVLVGTALIAQNNKSQQINDDFLTSYANLASVSLSRVQAEELKTQSEIKYKTLFESAGNAILILKDNIFTDCNNKATELFNMSYKEILNNSLSDLSPESQPDGTNSLLKLKEYNRAALQNSFIQFEWQQKKKDGELFDAEITLQTVSINNEIHIQAIVRDISATKKLMRLLQESEEKYRLIAENTADTITIINLDFSFAYVSPSIKKLLGYTPEEYLKLGIKDIFPVESVKAVQKMLQEEMELEKSGNTDPTRSRTIEIQEFHKDGKLIWVESTASFIRDKSGYPVSILAISRDITQEKLIQEKLIESEEKFRLLAENSPFAIMIYQEDKWVYSNPAGEKISEFSCKELYKMNFWDFVHPEDQRKVKTLGQARQRGENPESSYEFRIQTKNNEIKWVLLTGTPIQYKGAGAGLISIADITARKEQEAALRENDLQIRNYFDNAPYGIFIANKKGKYIQVNPTASIITGYSEKELLKMSIPDIYPKEQVKEAGESFQQLQEKDRIFQESPFKRKDGSIGWWSVSAVKLNDDEFLGFVEDITDKKDAENALIESRSLFRTVANNSHVGIFRVNEEGLTTYVNPKYCEITDLSVEEAMGQGWTKALHPEDYDYAMKGWKKAIENQSISTSEYRFMHKDGRTIWVAGRAVPDIVNGKLQGYIGTINDITERKNFELSILESEATLKRAEAVAGFGNWSFNLNNNTVETSEGAKNIYGLENRKYTIKDVQKLPLPEYRKALNEELELLISEKKKYNIEFKIKRPNDGKIIYIHSIAEYDKDSNKVFGVIRDITHQKEIEKALIDREKLETELVQTELNKTKEALVRSTRLAAVGQVSATIAHDLRNPLGAVRNAAFYLKRKSNQHDDKTLKYFNIIDSEISTADRIISNMMQMTKMKEPQKEKCNLTELIKSASGSHYKKLNIDIETKLLSGNGELFCDTVQIMQVFRNLLENADQSDDTPTKVKIQYSKKKDYTEIIFFDNGPGVSDDVKHTIFEPLITTKAKGTGLGLTICKQIIEKHGGHIELIDKKNAGACFRIELPNE